jgi:hypothetical protein
MYPFLLNMWVMGKVTETKLQTYSPKYLTADELNMILATPQKD